MCLSTCANQLHNSSKNKGYIVYFLNYSTQVIYMLRTLVALCMMLCGVAYAQMPAAGYQIKNEAFAQFVNETGETYLLKSQPVIVQVLPVLAATLTPANDIVASPSQVVFWPHILTNTGNADDGYRFSLTDVGGDSGILIKPQLIHDVNKNGAFDAGDVIIDPEAHLEQIAVGQSMSLLVRAQLPATLLPGSQFSVSLKVFGSQGVPVLQQTDNVYTNAPQFVLSKNVNKTQINLNNPSNTLLYSLEFSNTGNAVALGTTVSIDGVNQQKVVFDDPLPVGVTFKDIYLRKGGGELLYHLKGESQQVYHRYNSGTLPSLTQIDRIAVAYSSFDVKQEGQIDVEVEVTTQQLSNLNNQFVSYYKYGNEEKQAFSNVVTTLLQKNSFSLLIDNSRVAKLNDVVALPHVLQNNGSFAESYTLSVTQLTNDNSDLLNVIIVQDINNNERYDVGIDQQITELRLDANKSAKLLLVGTVPSDLANQDKIKLTLTAQSKNTNQQQSVNDELIINSSLGSGLDMSLTDALTDANSQQNPPSVVANQPVIWKHILKNTGSLADSYDILVSNLADDNKDIANLQVFIDSNNNGVYDKDVDTEVSSAIPLNPQQQVTLFVIGTTPADAKLNDKINIALQTKGVRSGLIKNTIDTVSVASASLSSKNNDYTIDKQKVLVKAVDSDGIYLEAGVAQCNTRANVADKVLLRVRSFALEDSATIIDEEFVIAEEASDKTDSSLFRLSNPLKTQSRRDQKTRQLINVTKENQILEVLTTDKVEVTIIHCLEDDGKTIKKDSQNQEMKVYKDFVTKEEVKTNIQIFELASLESKNASYATLRRKILANQKLFLETQTEQCNTRIGVADKLLLRVRSLIKDNQGKDSSIFDEEFVVAIETGNDTGLFRLEKPLPTRSRLENTPIKQNEILETIAHDTVRATIMHCLDDDGKTIKKDEQGLEMKVYKDPINQVGEVSTELLVDPFGVVFDSKTGKLLNGATVKLIRVENGKEAPFKLFDDNGKECEVDTEASPSCKKTIITGTLDINGDGVVDAGDDGMFRFPFVPATNAISSFYRLVITAPDGYTYPSVVSPTALLNNPATKNRVIHSTGDFTTGDDDGSYGGRFNVLPTDGPVELDIPMDPPAIDKASLFIKKESNRKNAELGEFVDYTVVVRNVSVNKTVATQVVVKDTLPKGFSYVQDSGRVNKVLQNPQGGIGPVLSFTVGDIAADAEVKLTYRAHIGTGALHGDGINRVIATDSIGASSQEAVAAVKVTAGVFSQEAFVIGKVYTDCNRDGVQGLEEIGVPNVRLILEDGTYVVTDVEGKFNFYGLRPTTHVLKLDRTSLPEDVELIEQNVRNAGDPSSRFVDLKSGEIHRADFAITTDNATCSGPAMAEIYARRNQGDKAIGELERELKADLTFERNNPSDVRSLPANGCVNYTGNECGLHGKAKMPTLTTAVVKADQNSQEDDINRIELAKDNRSLESYLDNTSSNQLDILNLVDGQVLPYSQTRILFKGVLGARFELSVNEQVLDEKSMGIRMAVTEQRLEAREYIGINLKAGQNRIVLKQFDGLGNVRGTRSLVVTAPANLAKLLVTTDQKVVEANGSNEVLVSVKLQDEAGVPITTRTSITLESNAGRFRAKDLDPKTQGIQLFVEGGEFSVKLVAPTQAGESTIRVSSGVLKTEQNIRFVPELRPMVAAGIVEGMVTFKNFDSAKVQPAYANDGFEAELQNLSSSNDGKLNVGGRAAMFLKGKVKGEYLLTLAYDSNKEKDQRLFRDIRPDDYYPVYGDSAVRGFDAQSTSKLYVRLDKGRSYIMFGDYTTRIEGTEALSLGQYNRSLTGIRGHYATDTFKATTFVAQTNAKQRVFEIPAQGISGPYVLPSLDGLKVNSEKVEIIKRDRNNLGLIINTEAKTRFTDYEFEALTSSIYFKSPVPSLDANLNPYAIRVTVEVEEVAGEDYVVGGVQVEQQLGKKITVGAAAVQEDVPNDNYQLASANLTLQLTEATKLIAEVAQSDRETKALGQASRAELLHSTPRINARVYYGESDTAFENPAAPLTSGRAESGIKATINMDSWGNLLTEAIRTENVTTGGVRHGVKVTISRSFAQHFTAELGGRFYDETALPANNTNLGVTPYEGVTVHSKLNIQIPQLDGASVYGEYEQDIENSDRKVISIGGDYQINSQSKLYAKHELSSSVNGGFGLNDQQQRNNTVIGVESNYMKDGRVFSEYRVRDAINAEDVEAAIGLRNSWYLTEGLRLNTNFEEVRTLDGDSNSDAIAASLGVEYLANPLWKATGKIDLRWADSADSILNTLGFAYKISRDWTLLTKNMLSLTDNHGVNVGNRVQNRFQLGAAYRQVDINRWDMLTKVEYKLDDNKATLNAHSKTDSYIFSNHINYHPTRRWTFASQLAAKWYTDNSSNLDSEATTYLIGGRIIHDISERWETSIQAGWLSGDLGGQRTVLGAEAGYLVTTNLWLSLGYNWLSYDDADLVGTDFTVDGAYMRLRFKFDEDLFGGNKPSTNKALEPKNVGL
ncbi:MAG TPA: hypothetical protein PKC11_02450 [Agitococcus sp.]|nr:hypothetical protein [Agitococcus sp.]